MLVDLVEDRSAEHGAATGVVPVISKELFEMLLNGRFAANPYKMDDLTRGVHPFTTGYFDDNVGGIVRA